MSKVGFALLLATGLSFASAHSFAAESPGTSAKKMARASFVRHQRVCTYKCPKGTFVCPGDSDGDNSPTGCPFYTCTKGRPGSDSCP
jgi:hypothetical protein